MEIKRPPIGRGEKGYRRMVVIPDGIILLPLNNPHSLSRNLSGLFQHPA
jgi:hypothetical protein